MSIKIIKFCDRIIEAGFLAIIFFIPLIMDYSLLSYNFFDLYKAVVFRSILTLILLAYAAKIFISGKISFRGGNKIFLLAFFLLASFFLSSLFSLRPNQSFWGSFLRQQGFYNFFHYLLFFTLIILNLRDFKQARRMVLAAAASAFLTAVYGLVQYLNLDPFYWTESALNTGRIFSTLGQPNFFGHFLILAMPLSLYGLIFMAKSNLSRFFVGLAIITQLVSLTFTYSRAAWLGFIGSIIFLTIFWLLYKGHKRTAYAYFGLLLIGLGLVITVNLSDKPFGKGPAAMDVVYRFKTIADFRGGSNQMRFYYLKDAWAEIKKAGPLRLWLGSGPETLAGVYFKYYRTDWGVYETVNTVPDRAHNWLFDQLLALGALGLLANLAFYGFIIYKAVKFILTPKDIGSKRVEIDNNLKSESEYSEYGPMVRGFILARPKLLSQDWLAIFLFASLIAYFINNLFSFSLFTVLVYLYFILGLAWFVINRTEPEKIINLPLAPVSKWLIWLSLLLTAGVFIYTNNINQARAEINYVKALKSFRASDCRGVMDNLEKTIGLSPNSLYYQENYLFLSLNCLTLVKNKIDQAEFYNGLNWLIEEIDDKEFYGIKANLARAYTLFGLYFDPAYYGRAEKIFNELILAFPKVDSAYEDLGKQKAWQGDYLRAIELYRQAIGVLPALDHPDLNAKHREQVAAELVRLYEALGRAYLKIEAFDLARDYFKKGLSLDPYRATLYKDLADTHYLKGELKQAIVLNQRGWTLSPGDYHWPLSLSLLYRDKKDLVKARLYLNEALKLKPEDEELIKYGKELNE